MSKAAKISILGGAIILLIVLLYFFGGSSDDSEDDFVSDSWERTYKPNDKGPYGTYVMKELLDTVGMFGNFIQLQDDVMESLEDDPDVNDIYFFIGETNFLPDSSAEHLLEFVEDGNTAFIASHEIPWEFAYRFFYNTTEVMDVDAEWDSVQYYKFTHPGLAAKRYKFKFVYNNRTDEDSWYYFAEDNFDTEYGEPIILGQNTADRWNYIKIDYGDGQIYLHSTPYCFTNISMLKRDGFQYAESVLEHIPPGRVQWDRYNLRRHYSSNSGNSGDSSSGGEKRRSILEFIMTTPPLAWAVVILLWGALLYVLFKGKRMQKIIPAAELKENTSMEYVNTLSSLYMQQGSHSKLIKLKEKTFLNFIGERYFIFVNKADERFVEKVAFKSQIDKERIWEIFHLFDKLNARAEVQDDELILLHKKIEYFYKNCR